MGETHKLLAALRSEYNCWLPLDGGISCWGGTTMQLVVGRGPLVVLSGGSFLFTPAVAPSSAVDSSDGAGGEDGGGMQISS